MWMPNFGKEGLELALYCITQSCLSTSLHPYLSLILFPYAGCFNPQVTKLWFDVSQEPPGSVTCSTIVWSPFSQTSSYHCQNIPNFMLSPCMTGCDSEFWRGLTCRIPFIFTHKPQRVSWRKQHSAQPSVFWSYSYFNCINMDIFCTQEAMQMDGISASLTCEWWSRMWPPVY